MVSGNTAMVNGVLSDAGIRMHTPLLHAIHAQGFAMSRPSHKFRSVPISAPHGSQPATESVKAAWRPSAEISSATRAGPKP